MFSHVVVGSNDLAKSKAFYDAVFAAMGGNPGADMGTRLAYGHKGGNFMVSTPNNGEPAFHANGGTIGFSMDSPEQAEAWHAAGLANGGSCEGQPESKPQAPGSYGAYLRDPDGNKLAAFYNLNFG